MLFFKHLLILLWKCLIIRRRNPIISFLELVFPLLAPLFLTYLFNVLYGSTPESSNVSINSSHLQTDSNGPKFYTIPTPVLSLNWSTIQSMESIKQLFYNPSNSFTDDVIKVMKDLYGINATKCHNIYDVRKEVKSDWRHFGIVFSGDTSKGSTHLSYTLMTNPNRPTTSDYGQFRRALERVYEGESGDKGPEYYYSKLNGFGIYQTAINEAFLTKLAKDRNKSKYKIDFLNVHKFPAVQKPPKRGFSFFSSGDGIALIVIIGYVILFPLIVKRITDEKSNKAKELLRMMGMSDWVFWSSHFINYLVVMLLQALFIVFLFHIGIAKGADVFKNVNPVLFFSILTIYSIQAILFCMSVTTVFNKPVIGVIVMVIAYILSYVLPIVYLHPIFGRSSPNINTLRLASSVLPSLGLTWALALTGNWASYGTHVGVKQLFRQTQSYGNITIFEVLLVQIFSFFLYAFLIWYLDAVWPFQFGIPKPVYFPCLPSYYCPKKNKKDIESEEKSISENPNFETEPKDSETSICLKNVTKSFGGGKGVNKMYFNIFSKQITVLLGHNGAGKTTTMNMITGIYPPTSGTIHVNGYNVSTATDKARRSIGLCPQENIIFNDLTVREHLKLYAVLKGYPCKRVETEIDRVLTILRLMDKKNTKCTSLSGGMKRKLCLGIAMIGDSKILILDEPTSGMDPEARRAVWDVLQAIRKDRTILLTTHYMEEADVLGDRIAIMANGSIKCCGSSMFLKKRFGAGYHLRISKSHNYNKQLVEAVLKEHLPYSRLKSEINIEVIYSLESTDRSKPTERKNFPKLFDEIDKRKPELGIDSYGLSVTTMEEVFLKVGAHEDEDQTKPIANNRQLNAKPNKWEKLTGFQLFQQRVCGLLLKRFHFARRYWPMLLFQMFIPALLFIIAFYLDYIIRYGFENPKTSLKLDLQELYGEKTFGFFNAFDKKWQKFGEENYAKTAQRHGMTAEVLLNTNDSNTWLMDKALNSEDYLTKYLIGGAIKEVSNLLYDIQVWFNSEATHSLPISINLMFESLVGYFIPELKDKTKITTINSPVEEYTTSILIYNIILCVIIACIIIPISTPFLGSSYVLYPIQEKQSNSKFLQLMTGLSSFTFWFCNFMFDLFNHSLAVIVLMVCFYYFDFSQIFFYEIDFIVSLFLILVLFGFCSIPIAYCSSFLFKQTTTGFTVLVVIYLFFGFFGNLVMTILHLMDIYGGKGGFSWHSYALNTLRLVPIFSMNFGITKLYFIGSGKRICRNLELRFNMTERCQSSLLGGIKDEEIRYCCDSCSQNPHMAKGCFKALKAISFESTGAGLEILFMLGSGILFFVLLMVFEGEIHKLIAFRLKRPNLNKFSNPSEDSDVSAERERVDRLLKEGKTSEEAIVVINLTKYFSNFRAVNHLTFCVHKNECFGLLGVNGAGKTTTFSMLTGDVIPYEGNAFMESLDLRSKTKLFQRRIGYCPQFDALLDRLTGEEMLYLFGRLRGIPSDIIGREVKGVIEMTDLSDHYKSLTKVYSGGNKRKLSLGLSIIGNPSLVFLDEPTAGVDPVARRKIWQTLEYLKNVYNSSLVLTSHSMEESEALCARIAIMVSGEFKCLGSTQHLRSKFGQGFTLVIKLKRQLILKDYMTRVHHYVLRHLPSAQLRDSHENLLHYHITDTTTKWSSLFKVMESAQQELDLEDYILSDTTLEQIFLAFAKQR